MKYICALALISLLGTNAQSQGGVEIFTENGKSGARHYGDVLYEANYDEIISLGGCDEYYFALREGSKWTIMYGKDICGSGTYSKIYSLSDELGKGASYHSKNIAVAVGKDGKDFFDLSSCRTDVKINTSPIERMDYYHVNEDWMVIGYKEKNGQYIVGQLYDGPYSMINSFVNLDSISPIVSSNDKLDNEELLMLYKTHLNNKVGVHSLYHGEELVPIDYLDIDYYKLEGDDYGESPWIRLTSENGMQIFDMYDRYTIPSSPVQDIIIDMDLSSIAIKDNNLWEIKTMTSDNFFMSNKSSDFVYPEIGFDSWSFDDVRSSYGYSEFPLFWVKKWNNWYVFDGYRGFLSKAYKKPVSNASYKKMDKIVAKHRKNSNKLMNRDESYDISDFGKGPFGVYNMISDGYLPQVANKVEHINAFLSVYEVDGKWGFITEDFFSEPIYTEYKVVGGKYAPVIEAKRDGNTYLYYAGIELPWPINDYKINFNYLAYKVGDKWGAMELTYENKLLIPAYDSAHISKVGPILWQNGICHYLDKAQKLNNTGVEWLYGTPDSTTIYFKAVDHAVQSYKKWYVFSDKYSYPKLYARDVDDLDDKTWRAYDNFVHRDNVKHLADDVYFQEGKLSGFYDLDKKAMYAGQQEAKAFYKGVIKNPVVAGNHSGVIALEFETLDGFGIYSTAWKHRNHSFITMDFDKVEYIKEKTMWLLTTDGKQAGFSIFAFDRDMDAIRWYDTVKLENEFGWLKGSNGKDSYLYSPRSGTEYGPYEDVSYLKKNYRGTFYCFKENGKWGIKKVTKNGEESIEVNATHSEKDAAIKAL